MLNATSQLQIRDSALNIVSPGDGLLAVNADVALVLDGGPTVLLSGSTGVRVENDLFLDSAAAEITLGHHSGNRVKLTHVDANGGALLLDHPLQFGDSGTFVSQPGADRLLASSDGTVEIDAATTVKIDSDSGDISFEDGGVAQLAIDMDGEATGIVIKPMVASDDLIFRTQGDRS